jgi:hypothetical protein
MYEYKDNKKILNKKLFDKLNNDIKIKISGYIAVPQKKELLQELKEIYEFILLSNKIKYELKLFLRNNITLSHSNKILKFKYLDYYKEIDIHIALNLCLNILTSNRFGNNLLRTNRNYNKYFIKFMNDNKLINYNKL